MFRPEFKSRISNTKTDLNILSKTGDKRITFIRRFKLEQKQSIQNLLSETTSLLDKF